MNTLTNSSSLQGYEVDQLFSLKIRICKEATRIKLIVLVPTVNTCDIPQTEKVLKKFLPSIFESLCFNDEKLSFIDEVKSTEIGHLFEHILLEYLCYFKLLEGSCSAEFSGVTKWNWQRDPWGMFHITVNTGVVDAGIFSQALQQSNMLLQLLLKYPATLTFPETDSALIAPQFPPIHFATMGK